MSNSRTYRFKSFRLNVGERQLFDGDRPVPLTPKTFDVLVHLVENAGHLVHKDDLMKAVWTDSFVEEVNVPRSVHHLRKALGQDSNGKRFIETIPTKGYRFTMPVVSGDNANRTPTGENPDENGAAELARVRPEAASRETPNESTTEPSTQAPSNAGRSRRLILVTGLLTISFFFGAFWFGGNVPPSNSGTTGQAPLTSNSGAYRLYLEGKFILDRRHKGDDGAALAKFEEAIKLDPNFALAYAGKADAEWRVFVRPNRAHDDIARARASINKAFSLDPNSSYAHTMQCRVYATYDWDFPAAEKACRRAVEIDPRSHDARHELAMFLNQFAKHQEALAEIDTAVALAPTSFNKTQRSVILFHAKRYREASEQLEQVRTADPEYPEGSYWLWQSYALAQNFDRALEVYIDTQTKLGSPEAAGELRPIYSAQGWRGVQKTIAEKYRSGDRGGMNAAGLHCQLGNNDKVFELLEDELKMRSLWMIHLIADPRFDPCRDDSRFEVVLKRVGLK